MLGIAANSWLRGWPGTKDSLLGAGLGLALLLPFVLIRSLGAGDWKFVGALGAFLGPQNLLTVLLLGILVNGLMAVIMVIWKKRVRETARNMGRMLGGFADHPPARTRPDFGQPGSGESSLWRGGGHRGYSLYKPASLGNERVGARVLARAGVNQKYGSDETGSD